jgi:hypothetical protein
MHQMPAALKPLRCIEKGAGAAAQLADSLIAVEDRPARCQQSGQIG